MVEPISPRKVFTRKDSSNFANRQIKARAVCLSQIRHGQSKLSFCKDTTK